MSNEQLEAEHKLFEDAMKMGCLGWAYDGKPINPAWRKNWEIWQAARSQPAAYSDKKLVPYDDAARILQVAYMEGTKGAGYNDAASQLFDSIVSQPTAPTVVNIGIDDIALASAKDIALLWGEDRSQFIAKMQMRVIAALESLAPAQQEPVSDDLVLVPRGLIGAACAAIDKKREAPRTLAQLRRYTIGGLSSPQPAQPSVPVEALKSLIREDGFAECAHNGSGYIEWEESNSGDFVRWSEIERIIAAHDSSK